MQRSRFLLYAQAVETYDFRRRDPYEIDPDAHSQRINAILGAAPDEWRDWLRMKLLSSNYRVLDQRIRDVLAECPTVSAKIVGATSEESDAFVRIVKNSRNYYTHYTPTLKPKVAEGAALYLITIQLKAIIEMSLLRELGFSNDAIDHLLDRARRYAEIQHFKSAVGKDS